MVESRVATQQGQDIGRLTRVTVVCLQKSMKEKTDALTITGLLTPESERCKLYLI